MTPYFCRWLWHAVTILCDGTLTCGLDDPFKLRNYGNVETQTIREILDSHDVKQRRHHLLQGTDCGVCQLHTPIDHTNIVQLSPSAPYPRKLVIETSIRCNIRCNNSVCNIANDSTYHVRTQDYLSYDVFVKVIDEIGPYLDELFFFNYGEPFINPRAIDMLRYARAHCPNVKVTSSTNGLLLARGDLAEQIVADRLVDWLCFTIGGSDNESYAKYHKSSSFEKAIEGMTKVAEAKRKHGVSAPTIHWRYLLFNWNDSDAQIARARQMAKEIGVDELKMFLTGTPLEGRSLRRAPGTSGFEAIRDLIDYDAHFRIDPFGEAGLWQPEEHGELGTLSWSGRSTRLQLLPEDGLVNVRLARPDNDRIPPSDVTLKTTWGTFPATVGLGHWADNKLTMPEMMDADEPTTIEVVTARPFTPIRHGIGLDGRELGVMVSLETAAPRPNPYRRLHQVARKGPRLRDGCDTGDAS